MRAAAYIRVSTPGQVEEGHSLEAQTQDIYAFANVKGWDIIATYADEGMSGSLADRPGLVRLLRDAEAGLFEVVIVHKVDRFFRDLAGFLSALSRLNEANVSFLSVRENIDFTSPWGKLALVILATIAEIFLDMLRDETMKGKKQRVRKGMWNGSIPNGYCLGNCSSCNDYNGPGYCPNVGRENIGDGRNLAPHPLDSIAVRKMFEWYVHGDHSDADIAERINSYEHVLPDGTVVHFRSRGRGQGSGFPPGPYGKDTIRSMLQHVVYTGVITYKGDALPGNHPAIIDEESFAQAQRVRRLRGTNPQSQNTTSKAMARAFLLTGILRCGQCGSQMRGQTGAKKVRFYQCVNRLQKKQPCRQPMVKAEPLEQALVQLVQSVRIPEEGREQVLAKAFPHCDVAAIEMQEAELRARYERVVELYLAGKIKRTKFDEEELAYRRDAVRLTSGQSGAILEAVRLVTRFPTLWETSTVLEQKAVLQTILSTVHIRGEKIEGVQPQPGFYALFEYWSYGSDGDRPPPKVKKR